MEEEKSEGMPEGADDRPEIRLQPEEGSKESSLPERAPETEPDGKPEAAGENLHEKNLIKPGFRFTWRYLLLIMCLILAASVLLTYTLTSAAQRKHYTALLLQQQELIGKLNTQESVQSQNFKILMMILEQYSYYSESMSEEEMLEAAFRAYVNASGDRYARYYTEEEYQQMLVDNSGNYCGIGITVENSSVQKDGQTVSTLKVSEIYPDSPAAGCGIAVGDHIYSIRIDGVYCAIDSMPNKYDDALSAMKGEEGSLAEVMVLRTTAESNLLQSMSFSAVRQQLERHSVRGKLSETDSTVGIVKISEFDLTTPHQFRQTVDGMLEQGVKHFVFDVRSNPGGDLQSIKAVLTYFLQEGDLILNVIDKDESVVDSHHAGVMELEGAYETCNVSAEEIGIYAGLDMVILCNQKTASAAEVFTATLQDHGLAKVVGAKTFGKGIMQSTLRLPLRNMVGYIKLTTYAYVTQRGVSYHGVGIEPDVKVELSDEAKKYSLFSLPQSMDGQLQTAIALFAQNMAN